MPSDPTRVPVHAGTGWTIDDVEIDERAEPARTRPFSDVLRLIATLIFLAAIVVAGSLGSETTAGLQEDITTAVTTVPSLVVSVLTTLNSLIVAALPLYLVIELAVRRRWRLLGTSVIAGLLAALGAELFRIYAPELIEGALYDALTLPGAGGTRTAAAFGLFAGVAALITVEGQRRPPPDRHRGLGRTDRTGGPVADRPAGHSARPDHQRARGSRRRARRPLRVRDGEPSERARGWSRPHSLASGCCPHGCSQRDEESDLGRRFEIETTDGVHALAQVLDPDRRTARVLSQLTRVVRVRTWVTRAPGISERTQLQQAAVPVLDGPQRGSASATAAGSGVGRR